MHARGQLDFEQPTHDAHDEAQDAAAAFGLALELPASGQASAVFWLWPECLSDWQLWGQVQTQWRYAGMSAQPTGLDYAAVVAWLRAHGYGRGQPKNLAETLGHLQAMERAALDAWAEQRQLTAHG